MPTFANATDIDQLIAALPPDEQVLVRRLRDLITECLPQATEKAYKGQAMPFYTRHRLICFIWPPSASLEANTDYEKQKAKGVVLGFNQGNLMSHENGVLQAEGRKQVYHMYFKKPGDIDENQLRALLFEAALIDEQFSKKKKR
ncbi:DUF1801 domain-containing protein [Dawidia soli]|uniref:DUF1801 domain-containing protein n=1 Tax=Dawidia soli TaxID=2782352 RepID=A0AAP2D7V6_9BACT|nr:DUF1801 domain-containing protein [Dawidia soli]MBT1687078.1 DUF1801 domain-containing protein [Dawidia soli]